MTSLIRLILFTDINNYQQATTHYIHMYKYSLSSEELAIIITNGS